MALNLENLEREVAENTTVVESAMSLINSLADELRASAGDPAALEALAQRLDASSNALAEAVAANTKAEDEPTE